MSTPKLPAMALALVSIVPLGMAVNKNFLPMDDESQFQITARAPEGASLQTTQTIMESIAARVRRLPEVETTVVTIGDDPQVTQNLGTVYIQLVPVDKRQRGQFDVMADIRQNVLPQYAKLNLRTTVAPVLLAAVASRSIGNDEGVGQLLNCCRQY